MYAHAMHLRVLCVPPGAYVSLHEPLSFAQALAHSLMSCATPRGRAPLRVHLCAADCGAVGERPWDAHRTHTHAEAHSGGARAVPRCASTRADVSGCASLRLFFGRTCASVPLRALAWPRVRDVWCALGHFGGWWVLVRWVETTATRGTTMTL